jgi:hypothetical protein
MGLIEVSGQGQYPSLQLSRFSGAPTRDYPQKLETKNFSDQR